MTAPFGKEAAKERAALRDAAFLALVQAAGLPAPTPEYRFHPVRKWRFDWAFLPQRVALEVEGGVFSGGRHTRGAGYAKDVEKYSAAAVLGWRVLRVLPARLTKPETIEMVRQALAWKDGQP